MKYLRIGLRAIFQLVLPPAQNRFIGIDHLVEEETEDYRRNCTALAERAAMSAKKKASDTAGQPKERGPL